MHGLTGQCWKRRNSSVAGKNLNISFYNRILKWFLVPVKLVVTWKDMGQGDFGRMWPSRISCSVHLGLMPKTPLMCPSVRVRWAGTSSASLCLDCCLALILIG